MSAAPSIEVEQSFSADRVVLASAWSQSVFGQRDHRLARHTALELEFKSLLHKADVTIDGLPDVLPE